MTLYVHMNITVRGVIICNQCVEGCMIFQLAYLNEGGAFTSPSNIHFTWNTGNLCCVWRRQRVYMH